MISFSGALGDVDNVRPRAVRITDAEAIVFLARRQDDVPGSMP